MSLPEGFEEIVRDIRSGQTTSEITVGRGTNEQIMLEYRYGMPGIGTVTSRWEGPLTHFRDILRKASAEALPPEDYQDECQIELPDCQVEYRDIGVNDCLQMKQACRFGLSAEFVASVLDKITPPPA